VAVVAGPIRIAILANSRPAIAGIHEVEQSAQGMGSKLGGVGKKIGASFVAMGAAVAVGAAVGFKKVIEEAASLSAAVGTTKTIFKDASGDMLSWSKTAATTLGLSQSEALNATKVFGGFFTGVGMGTKAAAGMSKNWTTMAANMAAFGDIPVAESLDAVKSALIGEYDPIQKLIPTISAATLEQKAMELSGKKNAKSLTAQDKAAALNAIMMDSMANKVGEAERKQRGYGVQMDVLKAQLKNAAAAVGSVFLPALTGGMAFINDTAIPAVKKFAEMVGPKIKAGLDAVGKFKPPKAIVDVAQSSQVQSILDNAKSGFMSLGPAIGKAIAVVMPIITAVASTLSAAFGKALPQIKAIFGTIGDIVGQVFAIVKAQISNWVAIIQFIWQNFGANILAYISSAFGAVVSVIQGVFTVIKGIFNVVLGLLTGDWGKAWDGIKGIVSGAWQAISGIWDLIKAGAALLGAVIGKVLGMAWSAVKAAASAAWEGIKALLVGAWNGIKSAASAVWEGLKAITLSVWNAIKGFISGVWEGIKSVVTSAGAAIRSAVTGAWDAIKSATIAAWNAIKSWLSGLWGGIKGLISQSVSGWKSIISNAWAAIKAATVTAWNAVKTAVTTGISNVVAAVKALPGKVKSAVSGAAGWLVSVGVDMIRGLISGIGQMADAVASKAKSVVKGAVDAAKGALGIASPSKVFMEIGRLSVQGMVDGLETGKADLTKTTESLIDAVVKAFPTSISKTFAKGTKLSVIEAWKKAELAAGKKRAVKRNALLDRIDADNTELQDLAGKRDAAAESLKAATDRVTDLQRSRADVVTSVAGAITGSFKLINDASDAGVASIDDMLQRSRDAVANAQAFAEQLKGLAARGVSPEILQELAMAGPTAGLETAKALTAASADQLAELAANYKAIASSGQNAGQVVAATMYDAGIAAAQSLAEGFASQQALMEASILQVLADLNTTITGALATVAPKVPAVEVKKGATTPAKAVKGKAVPVTTTTGNVTVTVNTGAIVDKRGMVDTISTAFNEVSTALGRPISMNVG
jgi:phage-related protein